MTHMVARLHTDYFSVEQLAALLGVAKNRITQILGSGRVKADMIEGKPYLHQDQLPRLQQELEKS